MCSRSRNMIVISDDDEGEVEEIRRNNRSKMGQKEKVRSTRPTQIRNDIHSDSEDEIHVIQEVSPYMKKTKGRKNVVIGSLETLPDTATRKSNIRRRVRPDSSVVKYCTIKRNNYSLAPFHRMCNSTDVRKQLFEMHESIRLEERRRYFELLKNVRAGTIIPKVVKHFARESPSLKRNLSRGLDPPDVECVDLTSDTENDVIELPQEKFLESEVEELLVASALPDVDVIELVEEPQILESSCVSSQEKFQKTKAKGKSARKSESHVQDFENQFFDMEKTGQKEESCESSTSSQSFISNDFKGNLEDRLLNQMILIDDMPDVIEVDEEDVEVEKEGQEEEEEEESEESFLKLSHEMEELVNKAFSDRSSRVLVEAFNINIRARDIWTLRGSSWLNDEVINFYMCLIMERGKLSSYPSVYCFNTFFYVRLVDAGHAALRRWTRKVDIFSYDMILVPIHLKVHWVLGCMNLVEKRIEYYDSMGGENEGCTKCLLKYLEDEHLDKMNENFDSSDWKIVNMKDIPEQLNGCDCGVFVCTYSEYISRAAKLAFSQRDMPYFRVKMAYEILTKKLLL